ncbi:hypothetical protein SAMN05216378_4142 [Paenibacillus catalpae]|uniref:Uncharacterized protein n=1 Tax=Paenibacillus catalpae TaxID=1045775 RepID=A0A1I2DLH3_9BACL|nr:hypothetical protein [Paenibacillus catalpae]SFE80770.1 hypothetical protein SAMN05216378_4142 [Paenibacillus catalpae]
MEIIDRYVSAVVKRLPEKSRAEVERELRVNIQDMLPDEYEEADVHQVLLSLGNPADLAAQYYEPKRYLISPERYANYMYVLKIVSIVAAIVIPFAAIVTVLTDAQGDSPIDLLVRMIVQTIVMAFQAVFVVFGCVTLIFALLERVDTKYSQWPYTGKPWTIKDLEAVQVMNSRSIDKTEPIFSIVISVFFAIVICFYPDLLGWYSKADGEWDITPLFNAEVLRAYVPFVLALSVFGIVIAVLKLIQQKWSMRTAWMNVLFDVCIIVFICAFFLNGDLFTDAFIEKFALGVKADSDSLESIWDKSSYGLAAFITLSMVWDGISGLFKARKSLDR